MIITSFWIAFCLVIIWISLSFLTFVECRMIIYDYDPKYVGYKWDKYWNEYRPFIFLMVLSLLFPIVLVFAFLLIYTIKYKK
jgi:hypothetical protein